MALEVQEASRYRPAHGLKIFWVGGDYNSKANLIFVHGVIGHPFDTWIDTDNARRFRETGELSNWFPWLSHDLPSTRVFTVGYPAALSFFGWAMSIPDRAASILEHLVATGIGLQPTVFMAHSLGGNVVKAVLRMASESRDERYRALYDNARGIVFFATPHNGSPLASLARLAGRLLWFIGPSDAVAALGANDVNLADLNRWMANSLMAAKCAQLYELRRVWRVLPLVVSQSSAGPFFGSATPNVPVDATHIGICKPSTADAAQYVSVRSFARQCLTPVRLEQPAEDARNGAPDGVGRRMAGRTYWDGSGVIPLILRYLEPDACESPRVAILVAPSGYGKTTLAATIGHRVGLPVVWLDPKGAVAPATERRCLLIIDDLHEWSALQAARRERIMAAIGSAFRVIVCARSESTGMELQGTLGGSPTATRFAIQAFSVEKAIEFLEAHCERPSILANLSRADVQRLCEASKGIPGLLFVALDVLKQEPSRLRAIIEKSRAGDSDVLAREMFKAWLSAALGDENECGSLGLTVLASDVCIFGLGAAHLAVLVDRSREEMLRALTPLLELGYLREALPGADESLVPHPILREAVRSGALPTPEAECVEGWRLRLANVSIVDQDSGLSTLTAMILSARETFQGLLRASGDVKRTAVEVLCGKAQRLNEFMVRQLVDMEVIQKSLREAIDRDVLRDCTIAVPLCRALADMRPRSAALGNIVWLLSQHRDGMARCDAIRASWEHWQGYGEEGRKECVSTLSEYVDEIVGSSGMSTSGFIVGCALIGIVRLGFENEAMQVWARAKPRMIGEGQEWAVAQVMMALASSFGHSPYERGIWEIVLQDRVQSECDAFARLYLFRGRSLGTMRRHIDPDGALGRQVQLPIRGKMGRILAPGFYADVGDYPAFVEAAVERGWLHLVDGE